MNTYAVNSADQPVAAVSSLSTDLADLIDGYKTMLDRADDDLKPAIERLLTLHEAHAAVLLAAYSDLGGESDSVGSAMGTVHSAVAVLRDWSGNLDASALSAIIDGENKLLAAYEEAAKEAEANPEIRDVITRQHNALESHVAALSA